MMKPLELSLYGTSIKKYYDDIATEVETEIKQN